MNDFDNRMRRLKKVLGLSQDKDVATVLGMTKASLSDRKRRGSFPDDRVVALVAKYPDLDVQFVLTGMGGSDRRSENSKLAAALAAGVGPLEALLDDVIRQGVEQRGRMEQEYSLSELVKRCADEDVDLLLRLAGRLASSRQRHAGISGRAQSGAGKVAAAADLIASLPEGSKVLVVSATEAKGPTNPKATRKAAPGAASKKMPPRDRREGST